MKKIQKEITIKKDIFVSVDGKEFDNEADCKSWEASYKGTLNASWNLIKKCEANTINLGLPWSNDDYQCYVVKPANLEEVTLINAYIASSTCNDNPLLTAAHIGKLVALDFGYDHDYCSVYALDDHIKRIADYIANLDNEMSENA